MAEGRKNNPIYIGVLTALLLLVVYVVFIKEDAPSSSKELITYERMGGKAQTQEDTQPEVPLVQKTELDDKQEIKAKPIESLEDLDDGLRKTIGTIDDNLDQAYQLDQGNERTALIDRTKFLIDSLKGIYDNPFLYVSLGDLYMLSPDFVKAADNYSLAMDVLGDIDGLARNYATACYNAAGARIVVNDTDAAITYMEVYFDRFPEDEKTKELLTFWYKKRAVGMLTSSDNKGGLGLLKKAYELDPEDYFVNFNTGIAYYRLNRGEEAIPFFKKCMALRKEDRHASDYLYIVYSYLGDTENADRYYVEPEDVVIPIEQKK